MSHAVKLSAMVVARNEELQLADCLAALKFCDEIVVVLDRSTDGSRAIALAQGARLVEGAWEIEGARRQAGQDACAGRYILEVDADERVTPELAAEIMAVLQSTEPDIGWWRIPVDNYIGQRLVRYGWGAHFGVSAKAVLYRKGSKSWGRERVHPKVQMTGRPGKPLQQPIQHYVDRDLSDMIQRLDRYSTLHAKDLVESGQIGTFSKNILRIFGRFWKCYVRRKGYKEGELGLVIAIFAALYPILSYVKAKNLKLIS